MRTISTRLTFFALLVILSCNKKTDIIVEKESQLSNLGIKIEIKDKPGQDYKPSIRVYLYENKNSIDISEVLLNGYPMDFIVRKGLYYTEERYFQTWDISRPESYYFELVCQDSIKYPIAYIKPKAINEKAQFTIPEHFDTNQDYKLQWNNLTTNHTIDIIRGTETKKKSAPNITEYAYSGKIYDTLTKTSGNYILQKSYLKDSLNYIRRLDFEIITKEEGLLNPKLLKSSSLSHYYTLEKNAYPIDENDH